MPRRHFALNRYGEITRSFLIAAIIVAGLVGVSSLLAISRSALWLEPLLLAMWMARATFDALYESVSIDRERGLIFHEPGAERFRLNGVTAGIATREGSERPDYQVRLLVPGRAEPIVVRTFNLEVDALDLLSELQTYLPERAGPGALEPAREFRPVSRMAPLRMAARDGSCRMCGTGLEHQVVGCPRCETPHHADCWDYAGGCVVYGCGARA